MRKTQWIFSVVVMMAASSLTAGTCNWVSAPTNIVFGMYSVFGSGSVPATSAYTFRCTPATQGVLTFTTGANSSSYFPRAMATAGVLLPYNVYDDAANTIVIGDGTGGTTSRVVFNSTAKSKDYTDTVYGAVPQGADVPPGTYVDTITAVLSWDNGAKSSSVTFQVSTVVQPECVVSTAAVNLGNYDPVVVNATAPLDGTGGISVYCTRTTIGTVALGNGLNFGGGSRRLAGPAGSFLFYQLYRDAARTAIWSTAPNTVSGSSTSRLTPIAGGMTVYGRVPAGQDPVVGVHSDTVQATVNY